MKPTHIMVETEKLELLKELAWYGVQLARLTEYTSFVRHAYDVETYQRTIMRLNRELAEVDKP